MQAFAHEELALLSRVGLVDQLIELLRGRATEVSRVVVILLELSEVKPIVSILQSVFEVLIDSESARHFLDGLNCEAAERLQTAVLLDPAVWHDVARPNLKVFVILEVFEHTALIHEAGSVVSSVQRRLDIEGAVVNRLVLEGLALVDDQFALIHYGRPSLVLGVKDLAEQVSVAPAPLFRRYLLVVVYDLELLAQLGYRLAVLRVCINLGIPHAAILRHESAN